MPRRQRSPSQRQLRVAEVLRHALAEILNRGDLHDADLANARLTVSEVAASADLRRATVYVMPLGGRNKDTVLAALARAAKYIRGQLGRNVQLKYVPALEFRIDTSFDYSDEVGRILNDPKVARDLR